MWIKIKEWFGYHVHDWQWSEPQMITVNMIHDYERDDDKFFGFTEVYRPHKIRKNCQKGTCKKCGMIKWRDVLVEN